MTELVTMQETPAANLPQLELEIKFYLGQTAQNIIEVGKRLIQAKSLVQHGEWQAWLQNNFQLSRHTAERFMKCSERFGKMSINAHFGSTQMITLLSLPDAEETEKFIEAKAAEGKRVADMTIKQLREEIDDYKKAMAMAVVEHRQSLFDFDEEREDFKEKLDDKDKIIGEQEESYKKSLKLLNEELDAKQKELDNRPTVTVEPEDYQPTKDALDKLKVDFALKEKELETQAVNFKTATEKLKADFAASDKKKDNKIEKLEAEKKRSEEIQKQLYEIQQYGVKCPDGLFDVIVIDPPWGYVRQAGHGKFDANGRRCTNPFPEMTQSELKAIELPAASDCVLFLWTTHKFIWDAKELLDHWGFDYRCMLVWNKQKMGTGNLIRMQCEFCLVALKGKPAFKDVHDIRDFIEEPRREHSRKPEAFYQLVETLCTGRKLDYFSRQQREGWTTYGNDTDKFSVA